MFIQKNLTKQINDVLYKYYLERFPYLKKHLPYKNPSIEQTNDILAIVEGTGVSDLLYDMKTLLSGSKEPLVSPEALRLESRKFIKEGVVKAALQRASTNTQNLAFYLSQLDPSACAVGGCVRDSILDVEPKDWDFVTSAEYETVKYALETAGFQTDETGKKFLVLIASKDGEQFEIARFRKDGMYKDGRHPDTVEPGSIKDDSERRDFTVNALYFRLKDSTLLDPTGDGLNDLLSTTLRFVGKPEDRLEEDALRAFRFYRFLGKGFTADNNSLRAVRTLWNKLYNKITPDRARVELEKMLGL